KSGILLRGICALLKQAAQFQSRFMQLRFRRARATAEYSGNLFMLVALDIVQHEYCAIASGQLTDGILKPYAINYRHGFRVDRVWINRIRHLAVIRRKL